MSLGRPLLVKCGEGTVPRAEGGASEAEERDAPCPQTHRPPARLLCTLGPQSPWLTQTSRCFFRFLKLVTGSTVSSKGKGLHSLQGATNGPLPRGPRDKRLRTPGEMALVVNFQKQENKHIPKTLTKATGFCLCFCCGPED